MNVLTFSYPTKVYFGENTAVQAFAAELGKYGKNVMLAYGGGSKKKNGIYDEIRKLLLQAGKRVIDFSGIMTNPTYTKVQEGAALAREEKIDFIRECRLPVKRSDLKSKVEITPEVLRQVADTCNIIQNGPRVLSREEI